MTMVNGLDFEYRFIPPAFTRYKKKAELRLALQPSFLDQTSHCRLLALLHEVRDYVWRYCHLLTPIKTITAAWGLCSLGRTEMRTCRDYKHLRLTCRQIDYEPRRYFGSKKYRGWLAIGHREFSNFQINTNLDQDLRDMLPDLHKPDRSTSLVGSLVLHSA